MLSLEVLLLKVIHGMLLASSCSTAWHASARGGLARDVLARGAPRDVLGIGMLFDMLSLETLLLKGLSLEATRRAPQVLGRRARRALAIALGKLVTIALGKLLDRTLFGKSSLAAFDSLSLLIIALDMLLLTAPAS